MKKILIILIALLFATTFVVANTAETISATAIAVSESDAGVAAITVSESDLDVGPTLVKVKERAVVVQRPITRLHLTGSGLAISEDDAFDFIHAKVVIGAVKVKATVNTITDSEFAVERLGVLMLDDGKYYLKNIAVSTDTISAEIFGTTTTTNADSESIGELKVKRFEKPGKDVWAGNMVLSGNAYNVYFLGMARNFKLEEVTEKIGNYCEENPDDEKCVSIVAKCDANKEKCAEDVSNYCTENSSDLKCLQIKKQYCLKNASDERCREYLKDLCEEKSSLAHCRVTTVEGKRIIGVNPTAIAAVTAERGESITSLVIDINRPGLKVARRAIGTVTTINKTGD